MATQKKFLWRRNAAIQVRAVDFVMYNAKDIPTSGSL